MAHALAKCVQLNPPVRREQSLWNTVHVSCTDTQTLSGEASVQTQLSIPCSSEIMRDYHSNQGRSTHISPCLPEHGTMAALPTPKPTPFPRMRQQDGGAALLSFAGTCRRTCSSWIQLPFTDRVSFLSLVFACGGQRSQAAVIQRSSVPSATVEGRDLENTWTRHREAQRIRHRKALLSLNSVVSAARAPAAGRPAPSH